MMDREEAIQILEEEANYLYKDDEPYCRQAFEMAIEALSAEPKWIPVSERLPETHGLYMVTFDNGNVYVARYDGGWYTIDSYGLLSMTSYVIAWMPLPTPYKGGDEE